MVRALLWLSLLAVMAAGVVWVKFPHLLYRFEKPSWQRFTDPTTTYSAEFPGKPRCGLEPDVTVGETCRHQIWNWDVRATRLGFTPGGNIDKQTASAGGISLANAEREVRLFMDIKEQNPVGDGIEFKGALKRGWGTVRATTVKGRVVLLSVIIRDAKDEKDYQAALARHPDLAPRFFNSVREP